jgi:hypothetical protein
MWNLRIFFQKQKKRIKMYYNVRDYARDSVINRILENFGMNSSLIVYNLITSNPIEIVIQVLSAKFGLSKAIISIIIIFLL